MAKRRGELLAKIGDPVAAFEREVERPDVMGARMRQSLRERYREPGMPPMLTHFDHLWPSEADDLALIAHDEMERLRREKYGDAAVEASMQRNVLRVIRRRPR